VCSGTRAPQQLGLVAIDGVPMNPPRRPLGSPSPGSITSACRPVRAWNSSVTGPPAGVPALLVTRTVDTGQGGENDPNRALASIVATGDAPEPRSKLPVSHTIACTRIALAGGRATGARVRKFYFSEKLENPKDPNSATEFYITEDGQTPAPFDPGDHAEHRPKQGDVEDWIIENRSTELHAFHIHQIHFMLVDWSGVPVNEPFLRDTVNVPYYSDRMLQYPSVPLTHGLPRSEHRRHLRLSLPSARA
jgi:FtsP/CotA-like multicopper oxidase with cupredoxin domain